MTQLYSSETSDKLIELNNSNSIFKLFLSGSENGVSKLMLRKMQSWFFFPNIFNPGIHHSLNKKGIYWVNVYKCLWIYQDSELNCAQQNWHAPKLQRVKLPLNFIYLLIYFYLGIDVNQFLTRYCYMNFIRSPKLMSQLFDNLFMILNWKIFKSYKLSIKGSFCLRNYANPEQF